MTLSLYSSGLLNIYYTFADKRIKKPFEVPSDIVNISRELMENGALSDVV